MANFTCVDRSPLSYVPTLKILSMGKIENEISIKRYGNSFLKIKFLAKKKAAKPEKKIMLNRAMLIISGDTVSFLYDKVWAVADFIENTHIIFTLNCQKKKKNS